MTSSESANYMETSSPDYNGGVEKKKPSLVKKVKAKAKKLKDKLTPGHGEGESSPQNDYMNTKSSSGVSSSDEEEVESQQISSTPLSHAVNLDDDKRTAHASPAARDIDYSDRVPFEDRKFGLLDSPDHHQKNRLAHEDPSAPAAGDPTVGDSIPLSQFRSAGPLGIEQAVPTSYHYYNRNPSDAYRTTSSGGVGTDATGYNDEARSTQLRGEIPSIPGGQSAGFIPLLSESTAFGSDKSEVGDKSFSSGEFSLQGSSNRSRLADVSDVSAFGDVESESSNKFRRDNNSLLPNDDSLGGGRRSFNQDIGVGILRDNVSDTSLENRDHGSVDSQVPGFQSSSTDISESQKPLYQRAYETVVGSTDESQNAQPDEPTMGQKVYGTIIGTKNPAAEKGFGEQQSYTQQSSDERTLTQKVYDSLVGVKNTDADKVGVETGRTDDSNPQSNSFFKSTVAPVSEFSSETESNPKPMTERVGETATSLKNTITSSLGLGGSPQIDSHQRVSTTTSTDQKPLTEKLAETGVGWKETVASKLGYGGSSTHTPGEEMTETAKTRAIDVKNTAADKVGQADVALSADSTPISQKGLDTVNRAKDYTVSTLSPTEDDKALSNTVTETLSNLPALFNEKLGFGGSSTTTPTSLTGSGNLQSSSAFNVPVSRNPSDGDRSDITDNSRNQSPGVMDRVTDAFSSLFGGDKKSSPNTPMSSPLDGRDKTLPSAMSPDLRGVQTPGSSPAA